MINRLIKLFTGIMLAVIALQACERSGHDQSVLATVNGEKIYQHDLDQMLERMLGDQKPLADSKQIEQKALESLVMMRAISQQQEKVLGEEERLALNSKANRYREELLLQMYLKDNTQIYAPSESEIRAYYQSHLEHFGAKDIVSYQIIQTNAQPSTQKLPNILSALAAAKDQSDWKAYAAKLKKQDSSFVFISGRTDGPDLHRQLMSTINRLSENEASSVVYLDKKPHMIKVTNIEKAAAKPLSEVRGQIRKNLAANKMKDSIKEVADKVLQQSEVQYMDRL